MKVVLWISLFKARLYFSWLNSFYSPISIFYTKQLKMAVRLRQLFADDMDELLLLEQK